MDFVGSVAAPMGAQCMRESRPERIRAVDEAGKAGVETTRAEGILLEIVLEIGD